MVKSVFLTNFQCPGDICMLTAAVKDLKTAYPELQINVESSAMYLWENNPNLNRSITKYNADKVLKVEYPLINSSNQLPLHFIHGMRMFLEDTLEIKIPPTSAGVDVYLTDNERNDRSGVLADLPKKYWIINAGYKNDFTAKAWEWSRYNEVVSTLHPDIPFVQIGCLEHNHKPLDKAINLLDKTPGREFLKVMYHSCGVLTGVSFPLHLSMMEQDPTTCSQKHRPCVCLIGGREPITWLQQSNLQGLHCCGLLPCCREGGCWRSRIQKLNDGSEQDNSLCDSPVTSFSGQIVPRCMDMISVTEVVNKVKLCHSLT